LIRLTGGSRSWRLASLVGARSIIYTASLDRLAPHPSLRASAE
jgi:hypothetical protein